MAFALACVCGPSYLLPVRAQCRDPVVDGIRFSLGIRPSRAGGGAGVDSLRGKLGEHRMHRPVPGTSPARSATRMECGQERTLGPAGPPCSSHHRHRGTPGLPLARAVGSQEKSWMQSRGQQRHVEPNPQASPCLSVTTSDHDDLRPRLPLRLLLPANLTGKRILGNTSDFTTWTWYKPHIPALLSRLFWMPSSGMVPFLCQLGWVPGCPDT